MKCTTRYALILGVILVACTGRDNKAQTGAEKTQALPDTAQGTIPDATVQKAGGWGISNTGKDTLNVSTRAAVFYGPTEKQIKKQKKEIGEEAFMTAADDHVFYMGNCLEYLEDQKLSTMVAKDEKFVKFVLRDQPARLVKLDTLPMLWGVFLFDPSKMPHNADITNMEEEYKSYFR